MTLTRQLADLHTHTTASDGVHAPRENVRFAKEAGLAAIAITDHDTTAGIADALDEGEKLGIRVVPGVEISTVADGQDIHVLGYYMNTEDPVFQERLHSLRSVRDKRNEMMIAKLNELGIRITLEDVMAVREMKDKDETVGRPHIAAAMVQMGAVASVREAFDRYLGKGGAAYVNPPRIHPKEAIAWIHEAGGSAVLAHPGLYSADPLIPELVEAGLDGMEVYHSEHTPEQEAHYLQLAQDYGLIVTAGSDFHGKRQGEAFHGEIGCRTIDAEVLDKLNLKLKN
ncbi:PHP domain-containing protein [Gorillibacterium massiliense]|uniref:PHP domain-containing protein n=1 Tax=Gorillibacterium massiliense TaxID=1280390 RepID=UPI0004B08065|nr:PHP domain-containing protein [Gorillibacterium massiliense]